MKSLIYFFIIFVFVVEGVGAKGKEVEDSDEKPPQEVPFVSVEEGLDQELDSVNGPLQPLVPEVDGNSTLKTQGHSKLAPQATVDIVPESISESVSEPWPEPQFVKPPGPPKGGVLRVPHPGAAKGLLRINKDGSYQYKTALRSKSQSGSLKIGQMAPPEIQGTNSSVGVLSYNSMYGNNKLFAIGFDYEWQPFTRYGRIGLVFGSGFATSRANGYFKVDRGATDANLNKADEVYNLYIIPASLFLNYRFEYVRRQWVVPFVNAGGTYFGLAEVRDDGKTPSLAGASAVGGGGGLMFSITALDAAGAFTLDREYGIADMYFTVEGRVMQGLRNDIDFTTQMVSAGITVDF